MEDLKATGLGLQDAGVRICTSGFHDFMVEDFKVRRADGPCQISVDFKPLSSTKGLILVSLSRRPDVLESKPKGLGFWDVGFGVSGLCNKYVGDTSKIRRLSVLYSNCSPSYQAPPLRFFTKGDS